MEKFSHKINYKYLSKALGISEELSIKFLNDGRIMGRLGEFILEELGVGIRSGNENTPYDNITEDDKRIEVRSITNKVSFASSKEIGFGRSVTEAGFQDKLDSIDYYVCIDFSDKDSIKFIRITKDDIHKMTEIGFIGKNKSISKKNFYKYLNQ
jgi:hypothetical protein